MALSTSLVLLGALPLLLLYSFQDYIQPLVTSLFDPRASISIIVTSTPHFSHVEKISSIATGLAELGYPVTFITGEEFKYAVADTAVTFERLRGPSGLATPEDMETFFSMPSKEGHLWLASKTMIVRAKDHHASLQKVLEEHRSKYQKIVLLRDAAVLGLLPQQLGAPGLQPDISMSFGLCPIVVDSNDTFPFLSLRLPDTTSNKSAIHHEANMQAHLADPERAHFDKILTEVMGELGAQEPHPGFWNSFAVKDDYLIQIGLPEFEYDRTDLAPQLVYLGGLPKVGGSRELPLWWADVLAAKKVGKPIVVISQGSAYPDLRNLLIPSLKALQDRDDLLVIGTTVMSEPEDVEGLEVPSNARVAKYIPFDLLLPEASLIIAAGGYGTVMQAISAGVPMVLAGTSQDKAHIGLLAEHKEIAVNLKTATPTMDQIREGVREILGGGKIGQEEHSKYHKNVAVMAAAMKQYRAMEILDKTILDAVRDR